MLRARRRVVLLDYPGYGFSDKPDTKYSLFAQADVVEACARELGLADVALVTHDVGDSIGGEILAREIDGTLGFHVTRRVLTNGSIYMDLVQLTDGQKFLLALPDEALPEGSGLNADGMAAGLQVTFAARLGGRPDDELAAMAELVARDGGGRMLPRIIRYIEERRVHEGRWTGAIEIASGAAPRDLGRPRSGRGVADGRARRASGAPTRWSIASTVSATTRWSRHPRGSTPRWSRRSRSSGRDYGSCDCTHASSAGPLSKLEMSA